MKRIYIILMTALGNAAAPLPFVIQNCFAEKDTKEVDMAYIEAYIEARKIQAGKGILSISPGNESVVDSDS
ncbi:MAG TPA: hypothetical protein PLY23_04445, partial [Alphaproteobacteria bacterium]|nr:hypothetical protein [Alphaproteobacteria bacterium]HQS93994.1 hypothetical protein [Alphaproteobacteria bacterium]